MKQADAVLYCDLMSDVKGRMEMLHSLLSRKIDLGQPIARIEYGTLLLRKALEQVALGSLIANRDAFCRAHSNFEKAWHARLILQDLERVNPQFYPQPVNEEENPEPGVRAKLTNMTEGFLTQAEFEKAYDKCGGMLHASNPYGSRPDPAYMEKQLPVWLDKLRCLLERHVIRLAGDEGFYLIHLHEQDGRVRHYRIDPHRPPAA